MTELQITEYLNKNYKMSLKLADDKFSSYDAECDEYIVEYKSRRKYYPTKQIECLKLFTNFQKAELSHRQFLYVVEDERGLYVFNITRNISKITRQSMQDLKLPVNTDFGSSRRITKYTYNLDESLSTVIKKNGTVFDTL
jgi:hypothetical protein